MSTLRILIADDHALIHRGLRELLESQPDWTVCAEEGNGRRAVERASELKPDIAILDILMPDLNGIDAARKILKQSPRTKILILSMDYSAQLLSELPKAGVDGFVAKKDSARDLVRAVQALSNGQLFFPHLGEVVGKVPSGHLSPDALSTREREVLQLLAEGKSSKEVAITLGLSTKTVETHRANLMRKLEAHDVATLVRYAVRNKIIEP